MMEEFQIGDRVRVIKKDVSAPGTLNLTGIIKVRERQGPNSSLWLGVDLAESRWTKGHNLNGGVGVFHTGRWFPPSYLQKVSSKFLVYRRSE